MTMPDYTELLSRPGAATELPQILADELVNGTIRESTALTLGTRVPTYTRDSRIPVLTTRPVARWIGPPELQAAGPSLLTARQRRMTCAAHCWIPVRSAGRQAGRGGHRDLRTAGRPPRNGRMP